MSLPPGIYTLTGRAWDKPKHKYKISILVTKYRGCQELKNATEEALQGKEKRVTEEAIPNKGGQGNPLRSGGIERESYNPCGRLFLEQGSVSLRELKEQ